MKVSEERNRYKQEVNQMKTYGTLSHHTEKGKLLIQEKLNVNSEIGGINLIQIVLIAVILLFLGLYFSYKN